MHNLTQVNSVSIKEVSAMSIECNSQIEEEGGTHKIE